MKIDAAGRPMTTARRALLRMRDNRLVTVKEIANAAGVSVSTIKALIAGTTPAPALPAAVRMRDELKIPIEAWLSDDESQDSDLASFQIGNRR